MSAEWPFRDPENLAVFTTRQVLEESRPIQLVCHDADDGAWQFLSDDTAQESDISIIALKEALVIDPTLAELADLPLGWQAYRDTPSSPWKRETMTEDIFDIVNEHDEVVGRAPRHEVHARGLLHRAVHVLVFNARGEIFLQKRSLKKDRQPGVWDSSASGHVDAGENYDTCAVRELSEEIGLSVTQTPPRLFKLDACEATDAEFVWVYRCASEGPFTLHPDEIDEGGWFAPERVTRWMHERPEDFASAFRLIWSKGVA